MAFNRRGRGTAVPSTSKYAKDVDDELDNEDEEETEEEAPRRSRGRRDSSRPAGRRSSAREDDRRPAGRANTRSTTKRNAEGGWDALKKAKSSEGYSENLKIGQDEVVIKFLEPEPYVVYKQHWLQENDGRKSFSCLEEDCPLCDTLGDKPRNQVLFNVIDLSDPQKPAVKTWAMGIRLAEKIEVLSSKPRTSPIDREDLYWAVSKSGKGTKTEYNLEPLKADDLEDWDVEPLDPEEIEELREQGAGPDSVRWDSREDLEEIADDLS
ncbi:hypothetical protein GCM10010149_88990 [Nonomuraea roseoviolacea subsp. roseoviolacea]|uniref:hypothetical protein n=1 Tax=Nonomuraea roseoviolacea TaxID=103837 RepID=UPI0031E27B02